MKRLNKNLGFWGIFAISTGTTISGGFFLLPGLAAADAGSSIIIIYVLSSIPLIPALFSQIELATAVPRSGGIYFFIDRTLGPYFGTICGTGTWLAFMLKVAFALIGMGAYLKIFFPTLDIYLIAISLALLLGVVNLFGSKASGNFQIFIFFCLLTILLFFTFRGMPEIIPANFEGMLDIEFNTLLSTAGFVFMSYIGLTKITSLAEEIKEPGKNLPRGIFLSLAVSLLLYVLGLIIMVGVLPMEQLAGNLTPVAAAAEIFSGKFGLIIVSFGAILSFLSVANAGILSASRYPFAMSRDHLLPRYFKKTDSGGNPFIAIIITVALIVLILLVTNPVIIAKLASTFLLLIFSVLCFAVIVMRESRIESYDPIYKSPLYPWMQIFGIITSFIFAIEMGFLPFTFSLILILLGTGWYFYYVRGNVLRTGAIYNIFERLGKYKYAGIDYELRDLMKKKGLKKEDPFDEIIANSLVIDLKELAEFKDIVKTVSEWACQDIHLPSETIYQEFMDGTRIGATPVIHQIALPHLIIEGIKHSKMALVRSREGVLIRYNNPLTDSKKEEEIYAKAVFFLISPKNNPSQHLRILARIAGRVEENSFFKDWENAKNEHELKISMLSYERFLFLKINERDETIKMVNKTLREINFPKGSLVAWIKRDGETIIPDGYTQLKLNDILTVVGEPEVLNEIVQDYHLIRANFY